MGELPLVQVASQDENGFILNVLSGSVEHDENGDVVIKSANGMNTTTFADKISFRDGTTVNVAYTATGNQVQARFSEPVTPDMVPIMAEGCAASVLGMGAGTIALIAAAIASGGWAIAAAYATFGASAVGVVEDCY